MRIATLLRWSLLAVLAWLLAAALPAAAQSNNSCGPATTQGTAPADFRTYCWLSLAGYNHTTAISAAGQNFGYTLPDGTKMTFNLKVTMSNTSTLAAVGVPAWTGGAFGNTGFNGIPGQPVLYSNGGGTATVVVSNVVVTPPAGGTASYSLVVADGEQTNGGESLRFTTNGGNWQMMAKVPSAGSTTYPTLTPAEPVPPSTDTGTTTVTISQNPTTPNGSQGAYVFRSDNNPTRLDVSMVSGGRQGFLIGARYASITVTSQFATAGRYLPADQFTYQVVTDANTVVGTPVTTTGTGNANNSGVTTIPTIAASYPFTVQQISAAGTAASNYSTTLTCVNSNSTSSTPMPAANTVTSSYRFTNLRFNDAIFCTFTNTPRFNTLSGTVYFDRNRNGSQDLNNNPAEAGPGAGFFVKLVPQSSGTCSGPASQVATPDSTSGAYSFTNLTAGTYCVVLDNNNTTTDVTATLPSGWMGTQNASGSLVVTVPLGSPTPVPTNFGLFNGARISGTVFADTGQSGGTANNGSRESNEPMLGGITVTALSGSTVIDSTVTAGDGSFSLTVPASVSGAITISATPPTGYVATGGSAGTTGGSYARPSVTFTPVAGQMYTGMVFGMVPPASFAPNGVQTAQPGAVVFYTHVFQAGTGGQVTFSMTGTAAPALPAWSGVLYLDSNCSGQIDNAEPVLNAAISVTAGQQVCLVAKQFVPSSVSLGSMNTLTITASFAYTNAAPALANATLVVTDVTTVGEPTALSLKKLVSNVTRGGTNGLSVNASPGETLQYTLNAQNVGGQALSTLLVHDSTPAYTTFVSAACPGTLPTGITACTISTQPAAGSVGTISWTFTGSLNSGASLAVTFQVKLNP